MHCPKRQAYETQAALLVHEANQKLESLRTLTERMAWEGRQDFERALDALRGQRNQALAKLEALRLSEEDAWLDLKPQTDMVLDRLRMTVRRLESRLPCPQAA